MGFTVDRSSYVAIAGQNPEMADYDNPRGLIYSERFTVSVSNDKGRRWMFSQSFADSALADRFATRVEARLASGGRLDSQLWEEVDPVYGSTEYQRQGIEWQRAEREREDAHWEG